MQNSELFVNEIPMNRLPEKVEFETVRGLSHKNDLNFFRIDWDAIKV